MLLATYQTLAIRCTIRYMKKLLLGFLVLATGVIVTLTYLGIMPVLSPLFVQAKDLGIAIEPEQAEEIMERLELENNLPNGVVPEGREPEYSGKTNVSVVITSEQATGVLAYWKQQYSKTPFRNVQVKFSPDGTAEASGILELATLEEMAKTLGYTEEEIQKAKSYTNLLAVEVPFYVVGTASVQSNEVSINPTAFTLGKINVPAFFMDQAAQATADAIEKRISQVPSLDIQSLSLVENGMKIVGTIPESIN